MRALSIFVGVCVCGGFRSGFRRRGDGFLSFFFCWEIPVIKKCKKAVTQIVLA